MSETRKKADWPIAALVTVLVLLLPILYVASVGPALWLDDRDYISDEFFSVAYAPIVHLYNRFDLVSDAIDWYARFWING